MKSIRRLRHGEIALLSIVVIFVLVLGWAMARDLRQSASEGRHLHERQSRASSLIGDLNFQTQEVRRIVLYALYTTDANLQLSYAEQSRSGDARVMALIDSPALAQATADALVHIGALREAWQRYLVVRDDVIGFILEGSLTEAVALDEKEGSARFNEVRHAITGLRQSFASEAALQTAAARARADRATWRLILLLGIVLLLAAVGMYLVNRGASLAVLLRAEAHKGSILQAVPDPIISADADGCIIEFNEAAERNFGFTRAEVVGKPIEDVILAPGARGLLSGLAGRAQDAPRAVWPRFEATGVRRDGTEFPMEIAAVTHHVGRDQVSTVHVSDLTDRRVAEEQLRDAKEAAELADQAKSEFLATMSHELRTPLVGVIGITDLLQTVELPRAQRHLVRMLRSSASALLSLVSDILDYSRIEAGLVDLQPECFPLEACVEDAIDPVAELAARKKIDIGYVVDARVPDRLIADRSRVRQVLLNLLSNAVKFTDTGEVALHVVAEKQRDRRVTVTVSVRDTGCGIPESQRHHLFQRFSQIPRLSPGPNKGTGLGLAISERLSRLLGGALTVESEPGRGSTFYFTFTAGIPADEPLGDAHTGSLSRVRVRPCLEPGIIAGQVLSLLRRWGVAIVTPDMPAADHDAIVLVDADAAADGRVRHDAVRPSPHRRPVVLITRLHPAPASEYEPGDRVVAKPIKAAALYEALCGAAAVAVVPEPPAPEARASVDALAHSPLSILLVEDNDANRRVIQMMLQELGVEVDEAADGLTAVECARDREYDLILMDVQMPGIDGLEATRRIRAEQSGAAPTIIGLTANVMTGDEAKCRAAGMDGYLAKPVRLQTLSSVLTPLRARHASSIKPS
ncbi:MAG TPA: ATP-binding protein [Vicinamibacterales bacterium]|nr:ATP-binding protein [Vicinamibacterales bacterium]